jgi:hypothetical protein
MRIEISLSIDISFPDLRARRNFEANIALPDENRQRRRTPLTAIP